MSSIDLFSPVLDAGGDPIAIHGGGIIYRNGTYYWYGEFKKGPTIPAPTCEFRTDFAGIGCYSSTDLSSWQFEGIVLESSDSAIPELHPSRVVERPKVIYNSKTGFYVMWMHIDTPNYATGQVGVARSESPLGPFTFLRAFWPNDSDSRDMTLFVDDDASAYLVHASDWNKTLRISRLTDDYEDVTGETTACLVGQSREAPAVWKYQDRFYMITSGTTGWYSNPALWADSPKMLGEWVLRDNPFSGPESRTAWGTQTTAVIPLEGQPGRFLYMADRWQPTALESSTHVWFEIEMRESGPEITAPLSPAS